MIDLSLSLSMAPPGESLFSTQFFDHVANASCPGIYDFKFSLAQPVGILDHRIVPMLMCFPYFIFWYFLRKVCKMGFPHIAKMLGLKSKKKQEKFSYQMWLGLYYTASTILGFYGYGDEGWFQFPLGDQACVDMAGNWPPTPSPFTEFAYQYQLGFYFAELVAIFQETRRSDFMEYVIHHVTTILLVAMSNIDLQTRVGGYVFFIHDIPDIFLCFAKCMHYLKIEFMTNILFVLFVVTFFFNRLICLPSATHCLFCATPLMDPPLPFTVFYQILCVLLGVVLQALHFFWFYMIMKMVIRLVTGVKGDVRPDDDEDEEEQPSSKKAVEDKKKK